MIQTKYFLMPDERETLIRMSSGNMMKLKRMHPEALSGCSIRAVRSIVIKGRNGNLSNIEALRGVAQYATPLPAKEYELHLIEVIRRLYKYNEDLSALGLRNLMEYCFKHELGRLIK